MIVEIAIMMAMMIMFLVMIMLVLNVFNKSNMIKDNSPSDNDDVFDKHVSNDDNEMASDSDAATNSPFSDKQCLDQNQNSMLLMQVVTLMII